MDIETLQLMLEMGPEAASTVKTYIVAEAVGGTVITATIFGFVAWVLRNISRSFMFEELSRDQKQEYLQRKFKVGKPNEESETRDV